MCGIAGSLVHRGYAREMELELLKHRGPDGCGQWRSADGRCWLGHTRLAILELSPSGAQPMCDSASGNMIVFNGEIYNHNSLRSLLEAEDQSWMGTSDTETILRAYRRWGREMLPLLKGMFAFALWDVERGSLLLARDRFGMKPLYIRSSASGVEFGSEMRVLDGGEPGSGSFARERVGAYLRHGCSPESALLWEGVHMLPPGCWMEVSPSGDTSRGRYWPGKTGIKRTFSNPVVRVRELLEFSVEDHLQSDVPVACFLSGGIDSSVITAMAAQKSGGRISTFSVAFEDGQFDESNVADLVSKRYGTDHQRIELSFEEVLESVEMAMDAMDVPSVDAINTFIVAQNVAKHGIKVALSGLGGDELFGGYSIFGEVRWLRGVASIPRWLRWPLSILGKRGRRLLSLPESSEVRGIVEWRRRFFDDDELLLAGLRPPTDDERVFRWDCHASDWFGEVSCSELSGYMRNMLLRDSDQMSMAVSLELRLPFLDHHLVEYVLSLPAPLKMGRWAVKSLLIEASKELLPLEVYNRPKMGFGLPMDEWIRGPLAGIVGRGLDGVVKHGGVQRGFVVSLMAGFESGRVHWTRVWGLVALGHYLNRRHEREIRPASLVG